jgi:protoporphyrinogen oxidase
MHNKKTKKVMVIGAGPAGLAAAHKLSLQREYSVTLIEASDTVGGMCKTFPLWGQFVDVGPHRFFSFDPRVNRYWDEMCDNDYLWVDRKTRIYFQKKLFSYPLSFSEIFKKFSFWDIFIICISYFCGRLDFTNQGDNFEKWVKKRFGKKLYEIFFKSYSEKLWGLKGSELSVEFAAQRIKKLSLKEVVLKSIFKQYKSFHSLVEKFKYPRLGTGMLYEKIAQRFAQKGTLILNKKVTQVLIDQNKVSGVVLDSGETLDCDVLISTMPLTHLLSCFESVPSDIQHLTRQLRFRSTILVYLSIQRLDLFPDQWLYINSAEIQSGRITNYRNWTEGLHQNAPQSILSLEYWTYQEDSNWKLSDEELINKAKADLIATGLCLENEITEGRVVRIPNCYPVYKLNYRENLSQIQNFLSQIQGLFVIGRGGAFKYNNQDHSLLMGLLCAENVQGKNHDLWSINSDYTFQEEKEN